MPSAGLHLTLYFAASIPGFTVRVSAPGLGRRRTCWAVAPLTALAEVWRHALRFLRFVTRSDGPRGAGGYPFPRPVVSVDRRLAREGSEGRNVMADWSVNIIQTASG